MLPFSTRVVDGNAGIMAISMTNTITTRMAEGKYVYKVTMKDVNGNNSVAVSGCVL